jgi:dTDP-4-amino-4,6-dideoxygalactose transaminase
MISNGPSPEVNRFTLDLKDPRFQFMSLPFSPTPTHTDLLINLGQRREHALKQFSAERFVFLDADISLVDQDYFQKLAEAHQRTGKELLITKVLRYEKILPTMPITVSHIDMANFSFSDQAAKAVHYPTDLDPAYGFANDYRFFERLRARGEPEFLDCVSAEIGTNRSYGRITDFFLEEQFHEKPISLFGNSFDAEDVAGLQAVLESHLVGYGQVVREFEDQFKTKIGFQAAVATNSCTNAFWLLCRALHLKAGDEVLMPNMHFVGIKNALELNGITPTLIDVDPVIPNLTLEEIQTHLSPRTRAIIFLDYGGWPSPIQAIKLWLAQQGRQDVTLILDAANSPFTQLNGHYVALEYDFVLYSFDMNKVLVTGDGGMVLSNNTETIEIIRQLAYLGMTNKTISGFDRSATEERWWDSQFSEPSLMLSMNNLAASLGLTQLKKIDLILEQRKKIVALYRHKLQRLVEAKHLNLPPVLEHVEHASFLFWIFLANEKTRNALAHWLRSKGVYTSVKYQPLDMSSPTPHTFQFYQTALCLPLHQNLKEDHVDYIVSKVFEFFESPHD